MSTKQLADFTAALTYAALREETVRKTKQTILDWLGVCIRGSEEQPVKILRNVLLTEGEKGVSVFAKPFREANVLNAAFCNGAASHTLDFDDLHNASIIHLATVVIPPVFAIGEKEHKTGKEIIAAIVAGYEVGARTGEAIIPESYHFWHTTGTAGTIGAGAAAASILGLDARATLMCLGTVGTQAAGLWEFVKEGAMSKPLHTGKGSYAAVLSAYLCREGFTGASQILEGPKGFCLAMTPQAHLEKLTEGLPEMQGALTNHTGLLHCKMDDNSYKPYSCCKHSHAAIYAIHSLAEKNHFSFKDVESIDLLVNRITDSLINNPEPQTAYGCKFSIQYCVAAMLKHGRVGIEEFSPTAMQDPDVRKMMQTIHVKSDTVMQKIYESDSTKLASNVVVYLKDGRIYSMQVDYPKGDPQNPMTWEETADKFRSLTEPVYGAEKAEKLISFVDTLDACQDFAAGLRACLA